MTYDDIKPYVKNAKEHPKKQIEQLAAAIREFGFSPGIEVDKAGVIICGHGRWEAAKLLELTAIDTKRHMARAGEKFIPVIVRDDLTDIQIRMKRLADNKLAESDMNMILAVEELKELSLLGADVQLTGFSLDLLMDPEVKDDQVPELPKKSAIKPGTIFKLGRHTLMCGDSTNLEHVKKLMGGGAVKADMVFTDPPYNVDYEGGGKSTTTKILGDKMEDAPFVEFLAAAFSGFKANMKKGAGMYVFHSSSKQIQFETALARNGLEIKNQLIWNKPSASMGWSNYRWKHEPFFYAGVKGQKLLFYGDRTHTTVIDFTKSEQALINWAKRIKKMEAEGKLTVWTMRRDSVNEYAHPTQKPVELITYAIINSSKADDVVMDLFGGSGSTLIAAEKTGRTAYLMELDPRWCEVIKQRYEDYIKNNESQQ